MHTQLSVQWAIIRHFQDSFFFASRHGGWGILTKLLACLHAVWSSDCSCFLLFWTSLQQCWRFQISTICWVQSWPKWWPDFLLEKICPENLFYRWPEPYGTFGLTSVTDVKACILPLAVSIGLIRRLLAKYRWVIHSHILTSRSALTPKPPASHEQGGGDWLKTKSLKHKVISSLKCSVGADMAVWKYENTF